MDEIIYYSELYDFYKNLLTQNQQSTFKDYFFENLTIEEIANNHNISKNAVSKTIITIKNSLEDFENKLHFKKYRDSLREEFKNNRDVLSVIDRYDSIIFDERD